MGCDGDEREIYKAILPEFDICDALGNLQQALHEAASRVVLRFQPRKGSGSAQDHVGTE